MQEVIDEKLLRSSLAANIIRLRRALGWSQERLAVQAGMSRTQLNRIENARNTPGSEVLYAIADALGVSTDALRQVAERISTKSA